MPEQMTMMEAIFRSDTDALRRLCEQHDVDAPLIRPDGSPCPPAIVLAIIKAGPAHHPRAEALAIATPAVDR